ncbi:MAG: ferrous iron transport protein B [Candidatus Diapherotrites archaeon]
MTVALAGNANVGKSVIFNHLTGLHQHIGNWPGKTVEKAEGTLHHNGREIDVIDLPGIYSLSTYSLEEVISREYIINEKPDVVINVVDASALERNLYFTFQLMELGRPMVMALNQIDIAKEKGISIDCEKLSKELGIPVIPTVAVKSQGIAEVLEKALEVIEKSQKPKSIKYGKEIENAISSVQGKLKTTASGYSKRWLSIKLLEGDEEIKKLPFAKDLLKDVYDASNLVEHLHDHSCSTAMACEIYGMAATIAPKVQHRAKKAKSLSEKLDDIITSRVFGYPLMIAVLLVSFLGIFTFGNLLASYIEAWFIIFKEPLEPLMTGIAGGFVMALIEGVIATLTVVIPYILPFYLLLGLLESTGYLARIAFLMDNAMHLIGLHGKAFIPLMMGFGCNVPACLSCRIMETHRERLIAVFVTTLIPCAAVTTVILGLVGRFVGIWWALGLYIIDALIIFILGRIAFKAFPGEPSGLIMEMPSLRVPHLKTLLKQTWFKVKDFTYIAFPIIIAATLAIKSMEALGAMDAISGILSPITIGWLGLPAITGILLIFGILRKELTLVMLAAMMGTTNFALIMSPVQMLVFALVTMLYIPCASTIAALVKETGWQRALYITVFEIVFAIIIGGLFFRLLLFLGV